MAEERLKICRKNKCGFYDKDGSSPKAFIPGQESCGLCGCVLKSKTASQDSYCALKDEGKVPLWDTKKI